MKKTQEILSLPIISISDGMEVGKVKSIIINADKGAIDYVVVDSGIQILSPRVIPTDNILGIGEYALTIENEAVISDISKIPAAIDLLQKNIQVKGTKVLTKKGRLIGEIGDIYIDEDDLCKIKALEYIADITQKKIRLIPRNNVITFGKNLIVVTDDVESALVDKPTELSGASGSIDVEKKNPVIDEIQINAALENVGMNESAHAVAETDLLKREDIENIISNLHQGSEHGDGQTSAAGLFEQRQRKYLIDRYITKDILDNEGNIIIKDGTPISEEVIDLAAANGKFIELVMNNRT